MQLAMVGLGRMGANLVRRLMRAGHECVVHDKDGAAVDALAAEGALPARGLDDLVTRLHAPRAVWVMLPHGAATESTITELSRAPVTRRRRDRRRQQPPSRRRAARARSRGALDRLPRHRHQRRRVGPGARLLPDDRRAARLRAAPGAAVRCAGAGRRHAAAHAGARGRGGQRRARLAALRTGRRRPLRQDDPQRHRVRNDAGAGRGLRHPAQRRQIVVRARAPLSFRPRRHRRGLAPRQRGVVVAARPRRAGARRGSATVGLLGRGRRFRRGPLDRAGRGRRGGARRGADRRAVCALSLAPGPHLCREDVVGAAATSSAATSNARNPERRRDGFVPKGQRRNHHTIKVDHRALQSRTSATRRVPPAGDHPTCRSLRCSCARC